MAPAPIEAPAYVQVPHPLGENIGDIEAVFRDPKAPTADEISVCDTKFRKLAASTASRDEILTGARELVRIEPVKQHWCFYGKILELEMALRDPSGLIESRQRAVTQTYLYLIPVAKAFVTEYRDSRYWRISLARYRRISELVFFRKVEPTPQTTSELVTASNPFAWMRPGDFSSLSVLRKYGLLEDATAADPSPGEPAKVVPASPTPPPTASADSLLVPAAESAPADQATENPGEIYPANEPEIPVPSGIEAAPLAP